MVRPERFELPTCCSGGNRSIQLSYGRKPTCTVYMRVEQPSTSSWLRRRRPPGIVLVMYRRKTNRAQFARPSAIRFILAGNVFLPAIASAATAAASTASAAITASAATTASAAAFRFRPRFVDVDRAPADLRAVQRRNRLLAVFVAGHLHESESTGASGIAVGHDADSIHLPERLKQLPQFVFGCVEAQIPHKDILHSSASALSCRTCKQFGGLAGREGLS